MRALTIAVVLLVLAGGLAAAFWPAQPKRVLTAPPPAVATAPFMAEAPPSQIFVTAFLPRAQLRQRLEAAAPTSRDGVQDNPVDGPLKNDKLTWKVTRGPIEVETDGALRARTRLEGKARINGRLFRLPIGADARLIANASITARPVLETNWRLTPNLKAEVDVREAKIPIKPLGAISVRRRVQGELEGKVAELARKLNDQARRDPFVEEAARRAQARLCGLHPFDAGDQEGWLAVAPLGWEASQPVFAPEGLHIGLGFRAQVTASVGTRPAEPDCAFDAALTLRAAQPEPVLRLAVAGQVPWVDLSALAADRLVGKTQEGAGFTLTPTDVSLAPHGEQILVNLDFEGALNALITRPLSGTVHLLARPELDPGGEILRLQDVTLWVESEAALSALAGKVIGPVLERLVADRAVLDLSAPVARAKANAAAAQARLNARVSGDAGWHAEGGLEEIRLQEVAVGATALLLKMEARGRLHLVGQHE